MESCNAGEVDVGIKAGGAGEVGLCVEGGKPKLSVSDRTEGWFEARRGRKELSMTKEHPRLVTVTIVNSEATG